MPEANEDETVSARKRNIVVRTITGILVLALAITLIPLLRPTSQPKQPITSDQKEIIGRIGQGYFNFTLARTPAEKSKGLSGTERLPDTDSMLFVYDESGIHCFWMKDMRYDIDILWFDKDRMLIYEKRDVAPETYPESFCPDRPAMYVAEVSSGVADKNQIRIGDKLDINL